MWLASRIRRTRFAPRVGEIGRCLTVPTYSASVAIRRDDLIIVITSEIALS
jgi:hypothetical protein